MTKEEFLSKVQFENDEEREDALFYINVKGLYLHNSIYNRLLKENNNASITWKQISNELRTDKHLRDVLYIYLATLEEYIRAYISNKYENGLDQVFWINGKEKRNKIKDNIDKGVALFAVLENCDFGTLIKQVMNLPTIDREELFGSVGTDENLTAVKELRNCVEHHRYLKVCSFKECMVENDRSNSLENNIQNLIQLLPKEYRNGKNGRGGIVGDLKKIKINCY